MASVIENNIEEIQKACKKHKLKSLFVFGSAVTNEFNKNSDVDFLYNFKKEEIPIAEYADNFFEFLFRLEDLLKRKIDLVPEEKIKNPYFLKQVNTGKVKIYGS